MTLIEIRDLILSVDPTAQHYETTSDDDTYTVWMETRRLPLMADNSHMGGWAFTIDRCTDVEYDPIASAFDAALDDADEVTFTYTVAYDVQTGLIHHVFNCQAL